MSEPEASAAPSRSLRGIFLMVLGIGALTVNDAAMKWVVADLTVGQAIFLRGAIALAVIFVVLHRRGGLRALRWNNPAGQVFCAACFSIGLFCFIYSLTILPLAIASVMVFTSPLFVTVLAPVMLGERVGWWRRGAVLLGFAGAAIVIRPGGVGFTWIVLFPLAAGFVDALRELVTRRLIASETSGSLLVTANAGVCLCALATAPFGWHMPNLEQFALLAVAGVALAVGLFLMLEAIRAADVSVVAPFKYSGVVWAILFGFVFWFHVPAWTTVAGAVLIVISGLIILHRERTQTRRATHQQG
jgi:drug/metabolite transporter (DMT)-like permease